MPKVQKFHSIMHASRWPTWLWTWWGLHKGSLFLLSSLVHTAVSLSPRDGSWCISVVVFSAGARALIGVSHRLLKIFAINILTRTKLIRKAHQHRLESLAAQYLTALIRTDKVYQLLGELNYCVEFSEH